MHLVQHLSHFVHAQRTMEISTHTIDLRKEDPYFALSCLQWSMLPLQKLWSTRCHHSCEVDILYRPGIVECLLMLKRLHEGQLRENQAEANGSLDTWKMPIQNSPVQTKDMKPFLGPGSRRDKSPLRRSPTLSSEPEIHAHPIERRNAVLTPNINFEGMADGLLRREGESCQYSCVCTIV